MVAGRAGRAGRAGVEGGAGRSGATIVPFWGILQKAGLTHSHRSQSRSRWGLRRERSGSGMTRRGDCGERNAASHRAMCGQLAPVIKG
jgi:hypothetical protein